MARPTKIYPNWKFLVWKYAIWQHCSLLFKFGGRPESLFKMMAPGQNVDRQNVDRQNVETWNKRKRRQGQNIDRQNVDRQNIDRDKTSK
jgi:hypothetical protein